MQLRPRFQTLANMTLGCVALTLGPPQASCGPRKTNRPHLRFIPQLPGRFGLLCSFTGLTPRTSLSLSNALSAPPLFGSARAGRETSKATNNREENKSNWKAAKEGSLTTGCNVGLTERACLIGEP